MKTITIIILALVILAGLTVFGISKTGNTLKEDVFTGKITNIKTTEKTPFWRRNINTTRSVLVIHNQDGSEERK